MSLRAMRPFHQKDHVNVDETVEKHGQMVLAFEAVPASTTEWLPYLHKLYVPFHVYEFANEACCPLLET